MSEEKVLQKITVRSADRVQFMKTVVDLASKGASIRRNTVPRMIVPFTLDMEIMVDKDNPFKSSLYVLAYPLEIGFYTEIELSNMDWDKFRTVCKEKGVKGRDREKMTEDYLALLRN